MSIHDAELARRIEALTGEAIVESTPSHGGDIGVSARVRFGGGRVAFAKRYPNARSELAAAEARGLAWLAEAGALRIPQVIAASEAGEALLVLEWIEQASPRGDHDEQLGRGLALLHGRGAEAFGFERDNFIGPLPQSNRNHTSWPAFYRDERLEPLARSARDLPREVHRDLERLYAVLEERCGPAEPPARLHGDLWAGNRITDDTGAPCLIDPAVYAGHREMDLAMMRLFGGFGARVFAAYEEAAPLAPGASERVALYQLYPLLVHVNLFGGGYVGQLREAIHRCL